MEYTIYADDHLKITTKNQDICICVSKSYSLGAFQKIIKKYPRVGIDQFSKLKEALEQADGTEVIIGELKPLVEVTTTKDGLKAYATILLNQEEFDAYDKSQLIAEVIGALENERVIFGILMEQLKEKLRPNEKILVAEGVLPIKGQDAIVNMYELKDKKPEIYQDGKVNHYELNLINKVEKGDWLGERVEPTKGTVGKTVYGEEIPAPAGVQAKLSYDRKTVVEEYNQNRTVLTLRAGQTGAVIYENDKIGVCNCLEIEGKVSFETGNIDFDGFVDVKDSVEDNFSVKADNDIQIMGSLGLGGVDTVESREGSIYIRGGIAGKNKATVVCKGDLYTKFAADCNIECSGTVNIGYYALNTNIKAKEVILESSTSKIIGGQIEANIRVIAAEIGNRSETPTFITVTGFSRNQYKEEYDQMKEDVETLTNQITFIKQKISVYNANELDKKQEAMLDELEELHYQCSKRLKYLKVQRKKYQSYLKTRGDGEVKATKYMYPAVKIQIKNHERWNSKFKALPVTCYVVNNKLYCE